MARLGPCLSFQYFVASSLDGFIATQDDNLDWLLQFDGFAGGQESYDAFMADVGCIVMGGETYAWLRNTNRTTGRIPARPAGCSPTTSSRAPKGADVTFVAGPVREFVEDLRKRPRRPERLDRRRGSPGGPVRGRRALDEMIISIIPVVLGSGKAVLPDDGSDAAAGVDLLPHHGPRHRGVALPVSAQPA